MNGFIIEMTREDETAPGDQVAERWIDITATARAMIVKLPGERPRVVARGAGVLVRACQLGLRDGEVRWIGDADSSEL